MIFALFGTKFCRGIGVGKMGCSDAYVCSHICRQLQVVVVAEGGDGLPAHRRRDKELPDGDGSLADDGCVVWYEERARKWCGK